MQQMAEIKCQLDATDAEIKCQLDVTDVASSWHFISTYLHLFMTHAAMNIITLLRRAESYIHKLEANFRLKAPSVLISLFIKPT